jgi:phenylacetate-coenzyme A ligase PaaK-like adenylate-forming protein
MGLGGAVECQARSGYHLREADLYFEIVDPETGEPRSVGELGEVVFTTLTRKGMPLMRYRTGDFARFLDEPCPCGTVLKRMERVRGRLSERVLLRSGDWLSVTDLDESLFGIPGLVNYDAVVRNENDKDRLELSLYAYPVHEQSISNAVQQALAQVATLREALVEGRLILGPITFMPGTWSTTGVAKRKITYQVTREEPA